MTKKERSQSVLFLFGESVLVNADALLILGHVLELNSPIDQSEKSIIRAEADIQAGGDLSAALTNKNVTGGNKLAVCTLHAKTLGFAITAVFGRTNALFVGKKLQTEFQHLFNPPY